VYKLSSSTVGVGGASKGNPPFNLIGQRNWVRHFASSASKTPRGDALGGHRGASRDLTVTGGRRRDKGRRPHSERSEGGHRKRWLRARKTRSSWGPKNRAVPTISASEGPAGKKKNGAQKAGKNKRAGREKPQSDEGKRKKKNTKGREKPKTKTIPK